MRFILDLDGSLCRFKNSFLEEVSKKAAKKRIPWPIVLLALKLFAPEIDEEMVAISNRLYEFEHEVFVCSGRPGQTEGHSKKYLERNKVLFYQNTECLGMGKGIVELKMENIRKKKPDIVVDDDEAVVSACKKEGIIAFDPAHFKKMVWNGTIR